MVGEAFFYGKGQQVHRLNMRGRGEMDAKDANVSWFYFAKTHKDLPIVLILHEIFPYIFKFQ